ncbi:homoserine kinase [Nocardioides sp. Iso805N]|uniref:homoserine kinase n=1 Tax=Nocardioides sp. Iso805N TaxID=1283287 RepID=UPI0003698DF0|nr:homoserine kinase [Nocardioides sp. Iso805N]
MGKTFVAAPVTITVPATSANLGPGFDSLGLALDLRDTLVGEVLPAGLEVEVSGAGSEAVPRDESHLVVRSMRAAFEVLGEQPPGLRLSCRNVIPHARGLGSSSAAIVGGIVLARALVADGVARLDDDAAFRLAAEIEGHPDNVAPAMYGGFTISGHEADAFYSVPSPVAAGIGAVVFVPPTGVETKVARGLLPATVPHADAAADAGRTALLVAALACRPDQLLRATRDYLHQDYRRPAMPESLALVDALRADGVPAVVSGAGPTVLALVDGGDARALLARTPQGWTCHALDIDPTGARVEE